MLSEGKVVTAKEVLSVGPQSRPLLETTIITLMHLAMESEHIELEVFLLLYILCLGLARVIIWGWFVNLTNLRTVSEEHHKPIFVFFFSFNFNHTYYNLGVDGNMYLHCLLLSFGYMLDVEMALQAVFMICVVAAIDPCQR